MNNVTFGDGTIGYYETVAGGAGAVCCGSVLLSRPYIFSEISVLFHAVVTSCDFHVVVSLHHVALISLFPDI